MRTFGMRRLLLKLSFSVLALSFVTVDPIPQAKAGFFEDVFGTPTWKPRKQRRDYFNEDRDRRGWQRKRRRGDVRIFGGFDGFDETGGDRQRGRSPRKAVADYSDPEGLPGLGMGNPLYLPPKLVPLFDPSIAKIQAADIAMGGVASALTDPKTAPRVEPPWKQPILDLYRGNAFKAFWLDNGKPSERAKAILAYAATTSDQGLDPLDYLPDGVTSYQDPALPKDADDAARAMFDVSMTVVALKLSQHLSGGRFEANRLSLYNDLESQRVSPAAALRVLAYTPFPAEYFKSLVPVHPAYEAMRRELAKLISGGPAPETQKIPGGKTVKKGGSDPRIVMVRDRLKSLGYFGADVPQPDPEFAGELDEDVFQALKAFQKDKQLKQSGRLDAVTVGAFNKDESGAEMRKLVINMERLRWLPRNLGKRHVFVNQPEFQAHVMDGGKEVWRTKVIVGRPMTQTYSFRDELETVVFNPSWGVPQSIIVNEYLKKLIRDPGYLDREGFKVVNQRGNVVSSRSINWSAYDTSNPVGVQQPPGSDNALGELKFLFPNKHSIYMHDTPTKKLFGESIRSFSHGCVRVENPREFARILLGWDEAKVAKTVGSGRSQSVQLKQKIPVHLAYFTAWPDSAGKMQYFNDIYGRDEAMERAVKVIVDQRIALNARKLVQN
jgi:L,D-transpeptidase YcbB